MTRRKDEFSEVQHETMVVPEDIARKHRAVSAAQCMVYLKKDESELEEVAESYGVTPEEVEKKLLRVINNTEQ